MIDKWANFSKIAKTNYYIVRGKYFPYDAVKRICGESKLLEKIIKNIMY